MPEQLGQLPQMIHRHCARRTRLVLCWSLATILLSAASAVCQEWSLKQEGDDVAISHGGELFTRYLTKTGAKPILWPIIGTEGTELTRAYPMKMVAGEKEDHPHQRSFWFTHGSVNGVDFWSEQPGHGSIVHQTYKTLAATGESAAIETENHWQAPDGKLVCQDERRVVFRKIPHARIVDFAITLFSNEHDVTFGDTKEGSFGIRVPTAMDADKEHSGKIKNSNGETGDAAWGKAAKWVDYAGTVNGKQLGILILNHPDSFRYPTTWHVRGYGLFAANPFGWTDFGSQGGKSGEYTLPKGERMNLSYRVIFYDGEMSAEKAEKLFEEYIEK